MKTLSIFLTTIVLCCIIGTVKAQNFIWANHLNAGVHGNAFDSRGNCYVGGDFWGSASIGAFTVLGTGHSNVYLAKCNPLGKFVQVLQNTSVGTANASLLSMCIDKSDHIYLLGQFEGHIKFGSANLYSDIGIFSYFIVKFDTAGNLQWFKTFNNSYAAGHNNIRVTQIACDNNDSVYVYGYSDGYYNLDGNPLSSTTGRLFLAKLNPYNGIASWAKQIQFSAGCVMTPIRITTDPVNNVLVCGTFGDSPGQQCIFNGTDVFTVPTGKRRNSFVGKFDQNGNYLWARSIDTLIENDCMGISIDANSNIYVLGTNFYAKYRTIGTLDWLHVLSFYAESIASNKFGNYIDAQFSDTLNYLTHMISSPGNHRILLKTDTLTGDLVWNTVPLSYFPAYSYLSASKKGHILYSSSNYFPIKLGKALFINEGAFTTLVNDTDVSSGNNIITGNIFNDTNSNCTKDAEPHLEGHGVVAVPGPYFAVTDSFGNYTLKVDTGNYLVQRTVSSSHAAIDTQTCPVTAYSISFSSTSLADTANDFATQYTECPLLWLLIQETGSNSGSCGGSIKHEITVANFGEDTARNTTLKIKYPGSVFIPAVSSIPWASYTPSDSTITFLLGDLGQDGAITFSITDTIDCIVPIYFYPFDHNFLLTPNNTCYPADSVYNKHKTTHKFYPPDFVHSVQTQNATTIYPNPANGIFTLKNIDVSSVIEIYNTMGQRVFAENATHTTETTIDITRESAGIYFLTIKNEKAKTAHKIIKL